MNPLTTDTNDDRGAEDDPSHSDRHDQLTSKRKGKGKEANDIPDANKKEQRKHVREQMHAVISSVSLHDIPNEKKQFLDEELAFIRNHN
jgi:hypothetical protein